MLVTKSQRDKIARILGKCEKGCKCIPEAHRIKRGYAGGNYDLKCIDWLCKEHHLERHCMERMGRK